MPFKVPDSLWVSGNQNRTTINVKGAEHENNRALEKNN